MSQSNDSTKVKLNKAVAELKANYNRRAELIKQLIPLLGELIRIEKKLPIKESKVDSLLRKSVNLPYGWESINSYLDDHPNQFEVHNGFESLAVRTLSNLEKLPGHREETETTEDEIPF